MAELLMPRLSDSMEEGTVLRWLKSDGDQVHRGEDVVEIETDKANMTHQSDQDGVLQIIASEGDTLPVGAVIAQLGDSPSAGNGSAAAGPAQAAASPQPGREEPQTGPGEPESTGPPRPPPSSPRPEGPSAVPTPSTSTSSAITADTEGPERIRASPVARRIARDLGIELASLLGTGPGGRIVKADVQAAADGHANTAHAPHTSSVTSAAGPPDAVVVTGRGELSAVELTRTQQVVARRMAESRATVPDFTIQAEVDMEGCVSLRGELKQLQPGAAPTYNDMVVRACALALREFPRANGSYRDGRFELHSRVNVGVAVAARDALIVPTVFDADAKSLPAIARETRRLAERVRDGSVTPPELSGATFTVSNLGMFAVTSFTAVINPPQAAILSVGAMAERAVVRDGEVVARHTMHITLACDHRILYGADAAEFVTRVRELLERPLALAFGPD